ncbi:four helix bundle protein [bacterium]
MSRDYKKLKVFNMADDLVLEIYRITDKFPRKEMFGLSQQMRRAAVSVPANIVEGCGRRTKKEYRQFLNISSGSLAEVGYYISLSHKLDYIDDTTYRTLNDRYNQCAKALNGLMNSIS